MNIEEMGNGSPKKELEFNEDGLYYFVDSRNVSEAEGFEFISSAYVDNEDFEDRILYIQFKDGYLGDFASTSIARGLDDQLNKIEGIEDVYWEDREFFHITYQEGQSIPELIKKIDSTVAELSKK